MIRSKASVVAILLFATAVGVLAGCSRKPAPSDAEVAVEIQSKLYRDSAIQSRQIEIQAANGVVTLTGDVTSDSERAAAASDAATVEGVRTVVNNLQVKQVTVTHSPRVKALSAKRSKASRSEDEAKGVRQSDTHGNGGMLPYGDALTADDSSSPAPSAQQPPSASTQPPPPPKKVTIPAGTQFTIRLNNPLDSERNQVGDTFHGSLSNPIVLDGETVVPSGADVVGRVAEVKSAGRFAGNSVLTLELTSLSMNGRTYNIQTNQWTRAGNGEGKNTATKVGVGTAAGAILGGIFGGGKGAAIGAAIGAGAGTGVSAAKKGQQIQLAAEAVLNFQTVNSLTVTPQSGNEHNSGRTPLS
jgi:hypothetical protein